MEILNLYQNISFMVHAFFKWNMQNTVLVGALVSLGILLILFVLQGFGLCAMAKRLNMRKKWLAFMPFANIYYMGKIVGECQFFGQKMKNIGLYTMIAQIITTVLTAAYIFANVYLVWNFTPTLDKEMNRVYWTGLTGFAGVVNGYYEVSYYFLPLVSLITQILSLILMTGLLRKYLPKNQTFLTLLVFFLPLARFILVFVARNREPFDYEGYMRRRREEYMRQRQQYYNNYGNPYGGYNNPNGGYQGGSPYGMGGYQGAQQPQAPQEEPFGEFSSTDKPQENSEGSTGDGFFD